MPSTFKRIKLSQKKAAKHKCVFFPHEKTRKRIYISTLGINTVKEFLEEQGLHVNEGEGYSDNFFLIETFDVADLKVGNVRLDCRCIVNQEYSQLWIPKKPFEFGYVFDFYVAVSLDMTKDRSEIVGFVTYDDIKDSLQENPDRINYYIFDRSILRSPLELANTIIPITRSKKPDTEFTQADHDIVIELFTSYLDDTLTYKQKAFFEKHISTCESCREELLYLHLFDHKIKTAKNRQVFIDENIPIEEAFYSEEEKVEPLEEKEKVIETIAPEIDERDEDYVVYEEELNEYEEKFEEDLQEDIEELQEITEVPDLSAEEMLKADKFEDIVETKSEPDTQEEPLLDEDTPAVEEESTLTRPFRKPDEELYPGILDTGKEIDIQPEDSYAEEETEPAEEITWEATFERIVETEEKDAFGTLDKLPEENLDDFQIDAWQEEEPELPEEFQTEPWEPSIEPEALIETPPEEDLSSKDPFLETPEQIEEFSFGEETAEKEDLFQGLPAFEETQGLPEDITREIQEEETYEYTESYQPEYIESYQPPPEFEGYQPGEPYTEESFEDLQSFENLEPFEAETPVQEEEPRFTLESLEEEHFDVLESFTDENILSQQPTIDMEIPEETPSAQQIPPVEPEYQQENTFTSEFLPQQEEYTESTEEYQESTDLTLEDLEKEFDSIASFDFDPLTQPAQSPEKEPEAYQPSQEYTEPDTYEKSFAEEETYQTQGYAPPEYGEELDGLFQQESQNLYDFDNTQEEQFPKQPLVSAEDIFIEPEPEYEEPAQYDQSEMQSAEQSPELLDKIRSELLKQQPDSQQQEETAQDHDFQEFQLPQQFDEEITYQSPEYGESQISVSDHYQSMPETSYDDYAQPQEQTEEYAPSDNEIADLKEFVQSQKKETKKGKRKRKKFPLLASAAIMIVLAGGLTFWAYTSGMIPGNFANIDIAGKVNGIMASLPKFGDNKKELAAAPEAQQATIEQKQANNEVETDALRDQTSEAALVTGAPPAEEASKATEGLSPPVEDEAAVTSEPALPSDMDKTEQKNVEISQAKKEPQTSNATPAAAQPPAKQKVVARVIAAPPKKPAQVASKTQPQETRKRQDTRQNVTIASALGGNEATQAQDKEDIELQTPRTIALEKQKGESFLPNKADSPRAAAEGFYDASFTETAGVSGAGRKQRAPQNPIIAGLEEKEESLKISLNPETIDDEPQNYITSAKVSWNATSTKNIEGALKTFLNSSTQKSKASLIAELKANKISGQLRPTVILLNINNSTNSITSRIVSSSGSSRVDNIILNAVRKSFSASSLPAAKTPSEPLQIKLTVTL